MTKTARCSFEDLKGYLIEKGKERLLDNVTQTDSGYRPSETYYSRNYDYSILMQIAAILTVLGASEEAENVHKLKWSDLSSDGDLLTIQILYKFRCNS